MLTTKYAKMVPTEEMSLSTFMGKSPPNIEQRTPVTIVLTYGV